MGAADMAFRAQLVIPEQRHLYDYWRGKCHDEVLASRKDIRPADFRQLLPWISLVDLLDGPRRLRVRLAGTQLREIYGRDITGAYLEDLDLAQRGAYWSVAFERLSQGLPAQGILPVHRPSADFMTRFWLRLPLAGADGKVNMVLGYDALVYASKLGALERLTRRAGVA